MFFGLICLNQINIVFFLMSFIFDEFFRKILNPFTNNHQRIQNRFVLLALKKYQN